MDSVDARQGEGRVYGHTKVRKGPHLDFGLGEICQRDRAFNTLCNLKKLCLGCEEVRKVCKVLLENLEVHK